MKYKQLSQHGMTSLGKDKLTEIAEKGKLRKEFKRQRMNGVMEKVLNRAKK